MNIWFIVFGIGCFMMGWGSSVLFHDAFGENYTYNMTKDELDELRLTELCYNLQKTNMAITVLDEFCRTTYGDIDSEYGDAIK